MDQPSESQHPNTSEKTSSPRRGRTPGSVSLTPEIQWIITNYMRGGAYGYVAAEAAGISARTFLEWMQRGEGTHPTRPPTSELRAFAEAVRMAQAQARIGAEVRVYEGHPARWLANVARSKPGREGWSDPVQEEAGPGQTPEEP
jgi:hypothetical protein